MVSVFIVTAGSYSDYRIVAVFTNKDKADALANILDDSNVEEWPIEKINANGMDLYEVEMEKSGNVIKVEKRTYKYSYELQMYIYSANNSLTVECMAKDEKHAIKITNEKRAMIIANNLWEIGNVKL